MLLKITGYETLNTKQLMKIYNESNVDNISFFFPQCKDKEIGLQKVEFNFLEYLRSHFFSKKDSMYCILVDGVIWVSALRLYKINQGFYFFEALETRPDYRKLGYASSLIESVINDLKKEGTFQIRSNVNRNNIPSIKTHERCGFIKEKDEGYDYDSGEILKNSYGMLYSYKIRN